MKKTIVNQILPAQLIKQVFDQISISYKQELNELAVLGRRKGTAGAIRQRKGALVVDVVRVIAQAVLEFRKLQKRVSIKTGEEDKQILTSKNGRYSHSQDLHIYIDGRFAMSIELKSYTESAMYKRVCEDARLTKKYTGDKISCILVELENARDPESQAFMDDEYGTVERIFTLVQGHRSSARPIHKAEFYKPLEKDAVAKLMAYFDQFVTGYLISLNR